MLDLCPCPVGQPPASFAGEAGWPTFPKADKVISWRGTTVTVTVSQVGGEGEKERDPQESASVHQNQTPGAMWVRGNLDTASFLQEHVAKNLPHCFHPLFVGLQGSVWVSLTSHWRPGVQLDHTVVLSTRGYRKNQTATEFKDHRKPYK